ncbi:MAG: lactoylglutathione lyase family protein [Microgenomates group bacterium Gr01-1014_7]|nr:MAG: lactoylglutathione lyase family protein [Microgenomates group bacterium Gr01-1014_7]
MNLADAPVTATLIVSNTNAAKAFYSEKLGLKQVADFSEDMGLMFEAGGGTRLYVYQSSLPIPQNTVASFKVDDVLATVNELKGKGVTFESYDMESIKTDENNIAHWGNLQFAWFKDPSGNIIAVGNQ